MKLLSTWGIPLILLICLTLGHYICFTIGSLVEIVILAWVRIAEQDEPPSF